MTNASATPPDDPYGKRFTDADRQRLGTLERVTDPTPMQRGEAQALRMRAAEPEDARRARALVARWFKR